ncbi:MAG: hypothetical protein RLZZ522_924 [Verrucomicrobiota bacterium]
MSGVDGLGSAAGPAAPEPQFAGLLRGGAENPIVAFDAVHIVGVWQQHGGKKFPDGIRMAGLGRAEVENPPLQRGDLRPRGLDGLEPYYQMVDDGADFLPSHDDGRAAGTRGGGGFVDGEILNAKHLAGEEHDGVEGLLLMAARLWGLAELPIVGIEPSGGGK